MTDKTRNEIIMPQNSISNSRINQKNPEMGSSLQNLLSHLEFMKYETYILQEVSEVPGSFAYQPHCNLCKPSADL